MSKNYEELICSAIDTIVNNAVANAGYDKTVQAKIVGCEDATIGKYRCKYQDTTFFAYTTNSTVTYTNNSLVYVLIPGNDFSRDKTILGTVDKLGINYAATPEGEEAFEIIGNNCISSSDTFELCSYETKTIELYNRNSQNNKISLDTKSIEEYLHQSSALICAAKFKTTLPVEQRFRGNFGIIYELTFLDNASEKEITRNYVLDVNQMEGNPYKMTIAKRQSGIFEIDSANFKYINRIYLFCKDFPVQATEKASDIFISELELCGSVPIENEKLSSYCLTFITRKGTYFDVGDLNADTRTLEAQVRVKGKIISNNSQKLEYY